jgi:hypothetical protein
VYTLYSRSCDPTVEFLLRDKRLSHEQIVESMVQATIGGFLSLEARQASDASNADTAQMMKTVVK